jgi:predicted site-specific integrase-resolvase
MVSKRARAVRWCSEIRGYRVNDFCANFGVGRSTAYHLINSGKLESVMIAGRRIILRDSAERLLKSGEGS